MNRAVGIDLSHWDVFFEPAFAVRKVDFAIQRTSYGKCKDKALETIYRGVHQVGIRGAYHYLSTAVPWQEQADFFLSLVNGRSYEFYACDFESAFNAMSVKFAFEAYQWMTYVAEKSKMPMVYYTNPSLYDVYGWHYCSGFPLWLAQYWNSPSPDKNPALPKRRKPGDWLIYQYACERNQRPGRSREYGCGATFVDENVFNGTVEDMRCWLHLGVPLPPPPPSPPPQIKKQYLVVAVLGLRVRTVPHLKGVVVTAMPHGTCFEAVAEIDAEGYTWAQLPNGYYAALRRNIFPPYTFAVCKTRTC